MTDHPRLRAALAEAFIATVYRDSKTAGNAADIVIAALGPAADAMEDGLALGEMGTDYVVATSPSEVAVSHWPDGLVTRQNQRDGTGPTLTAAVEAALSDD
jgi:hypothetical protein